ncbi:YgaP family membrane protein [Ancylobacter defluvii]|uniref:YgaP family membrane protein n=1 Tax=Ancylobacter defluvii TaxID=1282440 RepID=UPI001BCBC041|nr:DUF2892 domain-containing protein [Ancylobacter defluvii]MBS7589785.1 DUF2892 domain-containing protein [Ancylobacter defluvii]
MRIVIGLFSLIFLLEGSLRWIGLIGALPLVTALLSNCPPYSIPGLSTCPLKRAHR